MNKKTHGRWKKIFVVMLVMVLVFSESNLSVTAKADSSLSSAKNSIYDDLYNYIFGDDSYEDIPQNPSEGIYNARVSASTKTSVTLSWDSEGNNDGYRIYRKCQYDSAYKLIGTVKNVQDTTLQYKDSKITRGITFSYKIVSYRTDTETNKVTEGIFVTLSKKNALPVPTIASVKRSGKNAIITWKKIVGVQGYEVYRKNSGGTYQKIKTITNNSTLKWTTKNVSQTKATSFKVRAYVKYAGKYVYTSYSSVKSLASKSARILANKFKALMKKFPDGKYWNHVGKTKYNSSTVTNKPCNHARGNGLTTCNHYDCPNGIMGYQCYGFAWKMSDLIYGRTAKIKNFYSFAQCKAGDVIRYSGHSVIIVEKHSNYIVVGECNIGNTCRIKWGRKIYKSELVGAMYSHRYK